jgi:transposase
MPAPKKYPDEVRERAVRMVFEIREESGQQQGGSPGWRTGWVLN